MLGINFKGATRKKKKKLKTLRKYSANVYSPSTHIVRHTFSIIYKRESCSYCEVDAAFYLRSRRCRRPRRASRRTAVERWGRRGRGDKGKEEGRWASSWWRQRTLDACSSLPHTHWQVPLIPVAREGQVSVTNVLYLMCFFSRVNFSRF